MARGFLNSVDPVHPVSNLFRSDGARAEAYTRTRTQSNHDAQFQIVNQGKGVENHGY